MTSVNIEALKNEITTHLNNSPEKLAKYNQLISDFKANPTQPISVFDSIAELIKDNEQLYAKFTDIANTYSATEEPIEIIGNFVRLVYQLCSGKTDFLKEFTRLTSLFTEEMVPIDYYHQKLEFLIKDFDQNIQDKIKDVAKNLNPDIHASRDALFHRIAKNQNVAKILPQEFIVHQPNAPLQTLQLLAMIGNCFTPEQIKSSLNFLDLYSVQLLKITPVATTIKSYNETVGTFFENLASTIAPINFHPTKIYALASTMFKPQQLKWAVGQQIFDIISTGEEPKYTTPLQMAVARKLQEKPEEERDDKNAAPYIAELRAMKMYTSMKGMINAARNGDTIVVSEPVIRSILGSSEVNRTMAFFSQLYKKCQSIGALALDQFDLIDNDITAHMDKSGGDFRIHYKAYLRKPAVLRRIVLKGINKSKLEEQTIINLGNIIRQFVSALPEIDISVTNDLITAITSGCHIVTESGALAIFYALELASNIGNSTDPKVENLGETVLQTDNLQADFPGSILAQSDIILTRIARCLNSAKKTDNMNHFDFKMANMLSKYDKDFLFKVEISDSIIVDAIPNPAKRPAQ